MKDFVTFEIAKKLKEKGFNKECLAYYTEDTEFYYNTSYGSDVESAFKSFNSKPNTICGKRIDAPTISQVLKWLRKKKEIYLEIVIVIDAEYMCDIYKFNPRPIECLGSTEYFESPEQAAMAGIEYILDNLI